MIPEPSKLNWSTEKPTFEEVKGKTVIVIFEDSFYNKRRAYSSCLEMDGYRCWFGYGTKLIAYAVIADPPDPEPLPLWGVKPDIEQDIKDKYYLAFDYPHSGDSFSIVTFAYDTRFDAITVWNRIATALNEIGEK